MDDSAIMQDDIIDSYNKETQTTPTNFHEKKAICKFLYFTSIFINYYGIIDSCYYLLLSDKILIKNNKFYIDNIN